MNATKISDKNIQLPKMQIFPFKEYGIFPVPVVSLQKQVEKYGKNTGSVML
jgi:hypothetical protein